MDIILTLNVFTGTNTNLSKGETWGAEKCKPLYGTYQKNLASEKSKVPKKEVVGMDALQFKFLQKDGKYFFTWVFKRRQVYSTSFEGNKETLLKMFDLIEQTWD